MVLNKINTLFVLMRRQEKLLKLLNGMMSVKAMKDISIIKLSEHNECTKVIQEFAICTNLRNEY